MHFFLFVFGAVVGSFINVVSLRYKPGNKVFDLNLNSRSHCPHCGKTLRWYELIPIVSFLIQFGKCRTCGHKLSLQYPLVEIISGLVFLLVPSAVWIIIFLLLLLISIIDIRHFIIPDSLNLCLAVLGLILLFVNFYSQNFNFLSSQFLRHYAGLFNLRENIWINYFFAILIGGGIFALIILLSRGKAMGAGDVKLAAALGLIFGWPDILMVLFSGFLAGTIISLGLMLFKKKKIKDMVPFGPFLSSGAAITFFFGYQIIDMYFKIFNL